MSRLLSAVGTLFLAALTGACGFLGLGGPRAIDAPTVALRTPADADAAAVASALDGASPRAVFLASDGDAAWFRAVAEATGLHLSGPAEMGGLRMAFLAGEPVADTTVALPYDGGSLTVQDALYEVRSERYLDLIAFRIREAAEVRPAVSALLEYVATDVSNEAALVLAVAVPSAAAGDSVARMLGPAYFDVVRCEAGAAAPSERGAIRLFYGPAARMYCTDAEVRETAVGTWIRAELVMGRR